MTRLSESARGLSVLLTLNWDRILYTGALVVALYAGAFLASL